MGVKVNIRKAIDEYYNKGGKTNFPSSLHDVLEYAEHDENLTSLEDLAYLLGTAKAESDYSLTRWEADYVCGDVGVPYKDKPCQKALDYYASDDGKQNYYTLGTDSNNLPYFGRGLIQLTGEANYEIYGELIGEDLLKNGNLALVPKNSYRIASAYLNSKRGSAKKSTFDYVKENNLTQARRSVNGGTTDIDTVNNTYYMWLQILKEHGKVANTSTKKKIIAVSVLLITVGITATLVYLALKKANKLPKFMQKIKI